MSNTYPEPYRSARMDTLTDPSGCYNRQCVSYANWKVKEATGNWLPRPGSMNANNWDDYAAGWGFPRVDNPLNGGKYYGQTDNGVYGHVVWAEEVLVDGRVRVSEYNYIRAGEYSERIVDAKAFRWFQVAPQPFAPEPIALRDATDQDLADIWAGKYGNMPEREKNLINAGINPVNARARINAGEGKPAPVVFAKTPYTGASIVDGLKAIDAPSDFAYRAKLAVANGISNYTGTTAQNTQMLNALKNGQLRKV